MALLYIVLISVFFSAKIQCMSELFVTYSLQKGLLLDLACYTCMNNKPFCNQYEKEQILKEDTSLFSKKNVTPEDAIRFHSLIQYLYLEHPPQCKAITTMWLPHAIQAGNIDLVRILLRKGANPNKNTGLAFAYLYRPYIPLKNKQYFQYIDKTEGQTPLSLALNQPNIPQLVQLLVQYGADPYKPCSPGDKNSPRNKIEYLYHQALLTNDHINAQRYGLALHIIIASHVYSLHLHAPSFDTFVSSSINKT